ncbi:MAG: phenylalanine--tRNA ligase subunit alpha [Bacilli bacterium]|nr:phenylalanine--tRNA ligase subunit alpha [Bacilli bacterium]MDD3304726.1 phenylalanine--tRNA ligase subunit alpha [Bacilli bacterium]MDD4053595.1 phenylalanine--tRNA ligase subunit alpha [Bacilli bacterium]MDD4411094.1 phenylalanine--tRNA ligase subunit alpha [Bacilli bacterium]
MEKEEKIKKLRLSFDSVLNEITDLKELNDLKITYLGKKSEITELSKSLGSFDEAERKEMGASLNELRNYINDSIDSLRVKMELDVINSKLESDAIDVTLPSTNITIGSAHPLERTIEDIEQLFISMGYDIVEGPEVEQDLYNFEMLNLPKGHPARDAQDSFYITEEMLLRSQTSPVQVRTMLANDKKEPIRILCPGKTFRRDSDDATHSHQFTQIEGLVVDKNISLADLKGTFDVLAKHLFGKSRETRFRPSFYPFTEPSVELDTSCFNCGGKGCNICKGTGWITIGGAGVVHPNVLKMSGYDPELYTGFAFGMGVERIAMLKYGITDIRTFYNNDLRSIVQFDKKGGE